MAHGLGGFFSDFSDFLFRIKLKITLGYSHFYQNTEGAFTALLAMNTPSVFF